MVVQVKSQESMPLYMPTEISMVRKFFGNKAIHGMKSSSRREKWPLVLWSAALALFCQNTYS